MTSNQNGYFTSCHAADADFHHSKSSLSVVAGEPAPAMPAYENLPKSIVFKIPDTAGIDDTYRVFFAKARQVAPVSLSLTKNPHPPMMGHGFSILSFFFA